MAKDSTNSLALAGLLITLVDDLADLGRKDEILNQLKIQIDNIMSSDASQSIKLKLISAIIKSKLARSARGIDKDILARSKKIEKYEDIDPMNGDELDFFKSLYGGSNSHLLWAARADLIYNITLEKERKKAKSIFIGFILSAFILTIFFALFSPHISLTLGPVCMLIGTAYYSYSVYRSKSNHFPASFEEANKIIAAALRVYRSPL